MKAAALGTRSAILLMCDLDPKRKTWVQSWVQLEGLFSPKMVGKLRQINESLIGYEPEGREFESLRPRDRPCFVRDWRESKAALTYRDCSEIGTYAKDKATQKAGQSLRESPRTSASVPLCC